MGAFFVKKLVFPNGSIEYDKIFSKVFLEHKYYFWGRYCKMVEIVIGDGGKTRNGLEIIEEVVLEYSK